MLLICAGSTEEYGTGGIHWQQHDALGADLVEGLRGQGATIYGKRKHEH